MKKKNQLYLTEHKSLAKEDFRKSTLPKSWAHVQIIVLVYGNAGIIDICSQLKVFSTFRKGKLYYKTQLIFYESLLIGTEKSVRCPH